MNFHGQDVLYVMYYNPIAVLTLYTNKVKTTILRLMLQSVDTMV